VLSATSTQFQRCLKNPLMFFHCRSEMAKESQLFLVRKNIVFFSAFCGILDIFYWTVTFFTM